MSKMKLTISSDDSSVGYLRLPQHPGRDKKGVVKRTVELADIIGSYQGPDLIFDFDENDTLIGIEILGD